MKQIIQTFNDYTFTLDLNLNQNILKLGELMKTVPEEILDDLAKIM